MEKLQSPLRVAILLLSIGLPSGALAAPEEASALLKLAREKFAPRVLTEAEEKLFLHTEKGEAASMLVGKKEENDLAQAGAWTDNRTLHASSLVWLCTDPKALALVTHRGIQIWGMRIVGDVDLANVKIDFPLVAQNCSFEGNIFLMDARVRSVMLRSCSLQGLDASCAHFKGDAFLSDGCVAQGPIFFPAAIIEGTLNCQGSHLRKGLVAEWAKIGVEVFLNNGFKGEGEVAFSGATIGASLRCEQSRFINPGGLAWSGDGLKIDGLVSFHDTTAEGEVSFTTASIGRTLDLNRSRISNPGARAFSAWGAKIGGDLFARHGFEASGAVNLIGSTIGGSLEFEGAWISNPEGMALHLERTKIGGNVFFRPDPTAKPFRADGEVSLLRAIIGGSLYCHGARLTHRGKNALMADGCKITGNAFLRDLSTPEGKVIRFRADGAIDFGGAIVEDTFFWVNVEVLKTTILKLQSAKFATLHVQKETWPEAGKLHLDGLVYDRLRTQTAMTGADYTKWLELQPSKEFFPQPYEQLASVLRNMGREREARDVMVGKNRRYQKFTHAPSAEWWWYNVFGSLIGYGYLPSRPFLISVGFIFLGALLFKRGYSTGIVTPTKGSAYEPKDALAAETTAGGPRPIADGYPRFNALIYSLESFTPLLRLDQSSNWAPNANRGAQLHSRRMKWITTGSLLRIYLWIHIILGWILTSLWVGSITGLVKS